MIAEFKRLLVGKPLEAAAQHEQRLSKRIALAVFSSPIDYVLTVAVSISAGVFAITSLAATWGYPSRGDYRDEIALGCIALITAINLCGVKESAAARANQVQSGQVRWPRLCMVGAVAFSGAHGAGSGPTPWGAVWIDRPTSACYSKFRVDSSMMREVA